MADQPRGADDSAASRLRHYLRWPLPLAVIWLLAPVAGILIRLSLEPVGPHDYWWSLAMGKLIAATGEIPDQNLFVYTLSAHKPFFDQPWLSQWLMYACLDAFGHPGPIIVRNVLAALSWAGIVAAALTRCDDPRVVGGMALLAAAISGPVFGVRTQMFAFLPYVVLVAIVFAVAAERLGRRWLLLLVPLTALWANLHGTFMLVPVLLGLAGGSLVVERWLHTRRIEPAELGWWTGCGAACAAAAMANPLGPKIYVYVFRLTFLSHVSETVTEWQPPSIDTAFGAIVMAMLTASLVVLGLRRKKVRLFEAVLFAATAYLAVSAVRQMFWWAAVMLMVVPRHLSGLLDLQPWWRGKTTVGQGVFHAVLAALIVVAGITSQPGLPVHWLGAQFTEGFSRRSPPARGLLNSQNPTRIVAGLRAHGYPGKIFHDQAVGGFLEYALATDDLHAGRPAGEQIEPVAFVDQRIELIPESVWGDYFEISGAEEGWRKLVERHGIDTMLLWPQEQWRLIQALEADPAWTLVAVDEGHLLFFRTQARAAITRWRSAPSETTSASR